MGVITALGELLSPQYLLMMIAGTMGGIMIGAMPGLTSVMGVTLLLPFTYGMDPAAGISILLSISFFAIYGGSITAILIGTPGTPASAATMIEGRQFTARGEGGRAIGLSTFASWIGGTISALVLICVAPQLAKLALKFGPPEYFCLAVFGLTIIASISGKNMLKGIIAGLLGLLGVRLFIKVIQIKPYILTPIIFVLCILGSYALRNNMFDVGAMLLIAVVGYFFLKLEIPIAPIVLALILGPLAESNLRRSLLLSQGSASIPSHLHFLPGAGSGVPVLAPAAQAAQRPEEAGIRRSVWHAFSAMAR